MKQMLEVGDLVKLKCGGPVLTVTSLFPVSPPGYIQVCWIDDELRPQILNAPEKCFYVFGDRDLWVQQFVFCKTGGK